jgi:hypothetical protein
MRSVERTWLATAFLLSLAIGAKLAAAELRSDTIALVTGATSAAVDFTVAQPMRARIEATLDTPAQALSLVVMPASVTGGNRVSRVEGVGRAAIDVDISTADIQQHGRRWVAIVALRGALNPQLPLVTGRVAISDGTGAVASAPPSTGTASAAPPPPTGALTPLPPPRSAIVAPPLPSTALAPSSPPGGTGHVAAPPPPPSGSNVAPPPPPAPPPAPAAARFRVTLDGFTCDRETWDTVLQTDGKGDEIFIVADVQVIDRDRAHPAQRIKTPTYGDTNGFPQRIRAGSRSDLGGIRTGDSVPMNSPWNRPATALTRDRLPLVLWEGTLTDGWNSVVIVPTVWEEDSGDWLAGGYAAATGAVGSLLRPLDEARKLMPHEQFARLLRDNAQNSAPAAAMADVLQALNPANWAVQIGNWIGKQVTWVVGQAGDRPIGQIFDRNRDQYVFMPRMLNLDYRSAMRLATSQSPAQTIQLPMVPVIGAVQLPPLPPGVIPMTYADDDRLAGRYTLWLRVERLQ